MLELEAGAQPLQELVAFADEVDAEDARAESETDRLNAEKDEQAPDDQRVNEQVASEEWYLHENEQRDERPRGEHDQSRDQKEERRVVDDDESEVPPSVAEGR